MEQQIFDEVDKENNLGCHTRQLNYNYGVQVKHYEIDKKSVAKSGLGEGEYCIINSPMMHAYGNVCYDYTQTLFKRNMLKLLKKLKFTLKKQVFVVGLGNDRLLSDSLGDKVTDKILKSTGLRNFSKKLCKVCGICPSIYASTGIPTYDIIKSVSASIKPDIIFVIDSLATNEITRLGSSFQITTSSMKPGGAMDSDNKILCKESLGCDCIFIGVPLIFQMMIGGDKHMFAPKDIDIEVRKCARIISNALNEIFFPSLSKNEIDDLLF